MSSDLTRAAFPFYVGARSREVDRVEAFGNSSTAAPDGIEVRARIIGQMNYAELHACATREFVRWLRQRFRGEG